MKHLGSRENYFILYDNNKKARCHVNFESVSDFILNSCAVLNKCCWSFLCLFALCIWRCVLRPIRHLLCVLRYPCVFPGDGPGSVHQWRRHHLLEESLPALWGWEITFSMSLGILHTTVLHDFLHMTILNILFVSLESFIVNSCCKTTNHSFQCLYFQPTSGIGYATQVIEAHLNVYYIVILAWAIFYLFNCFTTELPWAGCGHYWNTGRKLKPNRETLLVSSIFFLKQQEIIQFLPGVNVRFNVNVSFCVHRELCGLLWRKRHQHYKPQRNISSDWVLGVSTSSPLFSHVCETSRSVCLYRVPSEGKLWQLDLWYVWIVNEITVCPIIHGGNVCHFMQSVNIES